MSTPRDLLFYLLLLYTFWDTRLSPCILIKKETVLKILVEYSKQLSNLLQLFVNYFMYSYLQFNLHIITVMQLHTTELHVTLNPSKQYYGFIIYYLVWDT